VARRGATQQLVDVARRGATQLRVDARRGVTQLCVDVVKIQDNGHILANYNPPLLYY